MIQAIALFRLGAVQYPAETEDYFADMCRRWAADPHGPEVVFAWIPGTAEGWTWRPKGEVPALGPGMGRTPPSGRSVAIEDMGGRSE